MTDSLRIVYEEDGFPRELGGPREWTRAVEEGSLTATSRITVHRAGERAVVMAAGDLPELKGLLAPAGPTPSQVAPAPTPVPAQVSPTTAVQPSAEPQAMFEASDPPAPRPAQKQQRPEPPAVWEQSDGGLGAARRASTAGDGDARNEGRGKLILGAIAGALLLLIVIASMSGSRTGQDLAADNLEVAADGLGNEAAPAEAGQAIEQGTAYEWTDNGSPQTYTTEGLQLVLGSEDNGEGGKLPVLTVRSADLGDSKIVGVAGGETASAKFMVLRPTRTDRFPSVLLMTYSMGAHCCTSFKLLTPKGNAWTLADLGEWDGEPLDAAPTDVDRDGKLDFVMRDNAFLYAFASYADSWTPSLIYNVIDGRFVDRTASPRFRSVHAGDMERTRVECAKHNNGACAAFVASAARIGQGPAALQFAAANFDQAATQGWLPTRCQVALVDGSCPAGSELQPGGFVEALDWFLQDHGYVRGSIQPSFEPDPEPDASMVPPSEPDAPVENEGDGEAL